MISNNNPGFYNGNAGVILFHIASPLNAINILQTKELFSMSDGGSPGNFFSNVTEKEAFCSYSVIGKDDSPHPNETKDIETFENFPVILLRFYWDGYQKNQMGLVGGWLPDAHMSETLNHFYLSSQKKSQIYWQSQIFFTQKNLYFLGFKINKDLIEHVLLKDPKMIGCLHELSRSIIGERFFVP
ncbi:hypothetical protein [Thiohalorhabdus denitrificans]|uniref:hypothetical protein n=1 Tax=Thiohalorhabdus denitrificans TaxID=381306 RepID=UPI00115FEECB|nr:hypothetical protein [Thiohalorhabdus denitrificans]